MFNLIFLLSFNIALTIATIYTFKTKKYLYLFIPCMLFLPNYFGISLNNALPTFSAVRGMFILLYIYTFFNKRRDLNFKKILKNPKTIPIPYYFLGCYFVFRAISNLYYITINADAIKTIFLIVFEQLLLLISIYLLAPTKEELITISKIVVWTATVLFVIGIIESFTFFRPFDALYTSLRAMLNDHYVRLGLLRSTTTMGLPGFYGNMCVLILVLILFLYNLTNEKKYILIIPLNILAIIHSGSRSDEIFIFFVLGLYTLLFCLKKERIIRLLKNTILVIALITIFILPFMICSPKYRYFYEGNAKSILMEFGADFDLNEEAPEGIEGYGTNYAAGSKSRIVQFTGITYTIDKNPFFGLGSGADMRNDLHYYWNNTWYICHSYDVGIVEIICEEGILGLIAHIALFIYIMLISINLWKQNKLVSKYFILYMLTYLVTTLSTANMYSFLILLVIYCTNYRSTNNRVGGGD
ncbi:O-antigen ligase family protein [Pseudobutyrivibrio xylanivorans]|uniref:O-Antigen ligase n=1 Tax=Pseudobutyrivibrio xylanivorans DSM 14809 TaxID=1123012 RepID=A0A1M6LK33_PSEXY|nr:O-antigen ligase family protein [Pseudobutyrivibrio xylanivorans]SHJ71577.1 O-Antigen ligase [Pseudobutyrivibrio xylanivorans DSM 14809]